MYRYKFLAFLFFTLSIIIIQKVDAKMEENTLPLFGKVITIDPGHGGIG